MALSETAAEERSFLAGTPRALLPAAGGKNGGGYQGILIDGDNLQGASESRRDGRAVGF